MHGKLRESIKRRTTLRENVGLVICAVVFLVLMILADRAGLPRKWRTAAYGTVLPSWVVITFFPTHWRRWTFWLSIAICLGIHTLAIYSLFKYVFVSAYPGMLIWTPVAFASVFLVIVAVLRLERKLIETTHPRGKSE